MPPQVLWDKGVVASMCASCGATPNKHSTRSVTVSVAEMPSMVRSWLSSRIRPSRAPPRASLATLDGMLAAYERVIATGFHMQWNVGQHTNDRELSFYCVTPSGFEWELGWNPIVVTPDLEQTWAPKTYDGISIWGHTPIAVSGRGTCRTTDRSPIVMHNLVHNCPLSRTTRARPNELALFGTAR